VLIDQLFWCPAFSILAFLFTGVTAGLSPKEIYLMIRKYSLMLIASSWMIWPAAHAVNFEVISAKHRLMYINAVQILYNTILSFVLNQPVPLK
jgi:protein Mpv17